ncbi:MAG: fatty acid kinase fatty acid binding subunit [Frankiaceae bacterium]|nr:fatty acid kinase fatty acid binding subunit [Frankiaceae bacterium]
MVHGVAVVTDSTAALPAGVLDKYDVTVVPLQVVLGGRVGAEGVDVTSADVAAALAARTSVSTSRPSPGVFASTYADLAAAGAAAIVSVHISAGLSGTIEAARLAAADAPVPVHVVDSRSTAMGLGFPALAAAEAAAGDATAEVVVATAAAAVRRTRTLFYVDSLDALRRGGRLGQAAALVGAALLVKPLLQVSDGRIGMLEKVRTSARAIARLEDVVAAEAGAGAVDVAVHHLGAPARAEALADRLRSRLPGLQTAHVSEVGAAVGAHVGVGLLGVVVHHR